MKKIYPLENIIQNYDWGSPLAIPTLVGYENSPGDPQAELWMGVNAGGESTVITPKERLGLGSFIKARPEWALGEKAAKQFGNLPFLFKILGIEKPLSIQAHPTKERAVEGFLRENKASIPLDAPHRNYRDSNHKPEIICALSPDFWLMKGFRPIDAIINEFTMADFPMLRKSLNQFRSEANNDGLKNFWQSIMAIEGKRAQTLAREAFDYAKSSEGPYYRWVEKLYDQYHNDLGVLAPLYLNVICLHEGQALYLPEGELHAYLSGLGIELMANSDNVLRGGLTSKFIDIEELTKNLEFKSSTIECLEAESANGDYHTPTDDFLLSRIVLSEDRLINGRNPAQIIFCTKGKGRLEAVKGNENLDRDPRYENDLFSITIRRGQSLFIPYNAGGYLLTGKGEFFTASIPF